MRLPRLARAPPHAVETDAAAPATSRAATCRNCGASAPGKYCPECGQETRMALPTLRQFTRDALGRLVGFDGRLWRTLYALVLRPGFLTQEYFAGRRRRYIRPARLFLVMSVAMFAVIGVVRSPADLNDAVVIKDKNDDANDSASLATQPGRGGVVTAIARVEQGARQEVRRRLNRFSELSRQEQADRMYTGVLHYAPYALFALLPAFALLQKVVYIGRHRRYPGRPRQYAEHLVYGAHLFAFVFLMVTLMVAIRWPPMQMLIGGWIAYYAICARRAVYGGRWWAGLARDFVVVFIFAMLAALTMVATVFLAVLLN